MREIIMVDEETRIRSMDALNWTVEVYRLPKKGDGGERWVQANGNGHGPFFGRLSDAFSWLLDYLTNRDLPAEVDMDGYVRAYRRTADRLMAVAKGLDR